MVERFAGYVGGETLAAELDLDGATGDHVETVRVEGRDIEIGLTATGTIFTETYG